jgi:hypothetical protein
VFDRLLPCLASKYLKYSENTSVLEILPLKCLDVINVAVLNQSIFQNCVIYKYWRKRCDPLFSKTEKGETLKYLLARRFDIENTEQPNRACIFLGEVTKDCQDDKGGARDVSEGFRRNF